jgi:hypothetical protein
MNEREQGRTNDAPSIEMGLEGYRGHGVESKRRFETRQACRCVPLQRGGIHGQIVATSL